MERITAAAILDDHGAPVFLPPPARHHTIIGHMVAAGNATPIAGAQGFMTSEGRFVDRTEGLRIAIAAAQIIRKHHSFDTLYSEDLW